MNERERPQVSWKAIEEDADLLSADGTRAGRVSRVVGDPEADVFTGLAVLVETFRGERFVAAERVVGIWPEQVRVSLTQEEIEALPKYEDVPVVRWRPGALGGVFSRLFGGRRR
ncbi:MAG: hypothetical protein M3304_01825 [Actinomycetota bacterium]|nr:hypothetical protein [Actinomycetota bacterium]